MNELHVCAHEGDISKIQAEIKMLFKRIDEQAALANSVSELAASVLVMAERMDNLKDTVESMKVDVKEIKGKPARRWEILVQTAITATVSALIAYMVARAGMG